MDHSLHREPSFLKYFLIFRHFILYFYYILKFILVNIVLY